MDDIVLQALAKWPHVPDCYGWLGLDARGNWFMRDAQAQAQGPFAGGTALAKGSLLRHEKLIEFIGRNYAADPQGQWFFQNGPQRVFVELEVTPLVWRINTDLSVQDHTGKPGAVQACLLDENGRLYLAAPAGLGLVHSMDMGMAADAVEQGLWRPQLALAADLPGRFNYRASPQSLQKT